MGKTRNEGSLLEVLSDIINKLPITHVKSWSVKKILIPQLYAVLLDNTDIFSVVLIT